MTQIKIKNERDIAKMAEGGKKLGEIRDQLKSFVKPGISALEVEELATKLIKESGASPSFKMVPGYSWSTCINVNDGVVHGIPKKKTVFKNGDLVSIDVGMYYKGFHTDTSVSLLLGNDPFKSRFLKVGETALKRAIDQAQEGNKVADISEAIENVITEAGFFPIKSLTGHGIGHELHEEPYIPGFVSGSYSKSPTLVPGIALAIEVMYSKGTEEVVLDEDGWTLRTKDGTLSALFEETVAVTPSGPFVLTEGANL